MLVESGISFVEVLLAIILLAFLSIPITQMTINSHQNLKVINQLEKNLEAELVDCNLSLINNIEIINCNGNEIFFK